MTAPRDRAAAAAVEPEAVLEIVAGLARELDRRTGSAGAVTLDTSLERDLGFDSLERVELLMRLEGAFGLTLPDQALGEAETPRDLLRYLAGSGPAAAPTGDREAPAEIADGEPAPDRTRTLLEVLDWHVQRHPERPHVQFDPGSDAPLETLTYGRLQRRARAVAGGLQGLGLDPGQTVALMLPSGLDYFAAFLGTQLAGAIPVPLYPPARPSQIEDHLRRQAAILRTAEARVLITFAEVRALARLLQAAAPDLRRVTTVADLERAGPAAVLPPAGADDIAFLQFTSGSTGDPKGVVLTHANLLANLRAIGRAVELRPHDRVVSWLPLYHDMGLIGAWMGSLYFGMPLHLMSPLTFLARPVRWLEAIHRHRGTASAAPNFAYELCLHKVRDEQIAELDLSSWRLALNGAESVSPETLRRFCERFAAHGFRRQALLPVYGLAECSLALAFPPPDRGPRVDAVRRRALQQAGRAEPAPGDGDALRFPSCGLPLPGHEIRVVDAAGQELGERREGRIQFRGPSATSGYYRNAAATARLFDGDWLDTGDLGYLAAGEIHVTGRVKDVIIRAGRNIYPAEVEEAVGGVPGVRKGCVAVFASTDPAAGTERMVVLAETRERDPERLAGLRARVQELALDLVGTPPDEIVLAPPHTVLKTSSGKIRRAASRELYESGRIGRRGAAVWWQIARLAATGLLPQARRWRSAGAAVLFAGYAWAVTGLLAVPSVLGVLSLPRLAWRRRLAQRAARLLFRLTATPLRVAGLERLPASGAFVAAANHASYLDGFVLTAVLPPRLAYLVKRELFSRLPARWILGRLGAVFVERFDPEGGVRDARTAAAELARGRPLAVFPEGTFGRAPGLLPFRMGAFVVAAEEGVPVVPVAIRGSRSVLRGDDWFPRRGEIAVTVCAPRRPRGPGWAAAVELREAVRAALLERLDEPDLAERG